MNTVSAKLVPFVALAEMQTTETEASWLSKSDTYVQVKKMQKDIVSTEQTASEASKWGISYTHTHLKGYQHAGESLPSTVTRNSNSSDSHLFHNSKENLLPKVSTGICLATAQAFPTSLLTVKILQARNITMGDLLSGADSYVTLWLPTASKEEGRTQTILNSSTPVWNETFYFTIQSQVKNILELRIYDEDPLSKDDLLFTVFFDVAEVSPGETFHVTFILNSKKKEELDVEFRVKENLDRLENLITNHTLVSRPVSCLNVCVAKGKSVKCLKEEENLKLRVEGSYEDTWKTTLESELGECFHFHYPTYWDPELKAHLQHCSSNGEQGKQNSSASLVMPLKLLSVGQEVKVVLPVSKCLYTVMQSSEHLDMRLGFDLCGEEKAFLHKRKQVVAAALKRVLQQDNDLLDHEIPVVAVMATGGGCRAMTSLYGQLSGLKKLDILDCITYISGTSGSTWAMSNLYEDSSWSQKDLERPICKAKKHMTKNKIGTFSLEKLIYYQKELSQRAKEGISTSFNDLWAVALENILHDRVNDFKLSDQQQAVSQGQNPLPLFLALNVKESCISTFDFKEWCEFSPYEVGFLKYGAFIHSEDFGSEFFMGRLMKKNPESRICYLEALWSNVLAVNLLDIWSKLSSADETWQKLIRSKIRNIERNHAPRKSSTFLGTSWMYPDRLLFQIISNVLTDRPLHHHIHNFLKGFHMHKDYYQESQFSMWKDSQLDQFPNRLTPSEDGICLVDAAYFINTSCPPLLRKEREVDVILSFDYSLDHPFQSIEQTEKYCLEQGIPFPKILLSEEDKENPRECYLFADDETKKAPIILHFPLVNDTFKKFEEPGVERCQTELAEGTVPLSGYCSPYHLMNFTYTKKDFDQLLKLTDYNIQNNRDLILEAFSTAIEWKRCNRQ
ncbi:cytosolic phospholipase A2 delta-like [Elgaria multicarinata webbii]|uniref:cytosolic phospholipase A2 delta-like n=1 Tax=Elgaria multicarinata webbii TaxID=159646 RepID=UPI002FCCFBA9